MSDDLITHVSDTARWVATYRAMESDRPDALFRDPFARRLGGEKGERIMRAMPGGRRQAWAMIVRTRVFDDVIARLVAEKKIDSVLNLAAGLDTRAYRLALPPELKWFDVDFPATIDHRRVELAGATPACTYEAIGLDLSDRTGRAQLFDRVDAGSNATLVVSEGLLIYLTPESVAELARDLAARPHFRYWLIDLASPLLLKFISRSWGKRMSMGQARFQFAPAEGVAFFEPLGWSLAEYNSNWEAAKRLNRRMPGAWIWDIIMRLTPAARREQYRKMAGSALLARL